MTKVYTPLPLHRKITAQVASENCPRSIILSEPGSGKTAATLAGIHALKEAGEVSRVLVVAPKAVAAFTWPAELQEWSFCAGWPFVNFAGLTPAKAAKLLPEVANSFIVLINFESIEKLAALGPLHTIFDMLVIDESSRLRSFSFSKGSAKQVAALYRLAGKIERQVQLTGTPAPNGLDGIYGQAAFISADIFGKSRYNFLNDYFQAVPVRGVPNAKSYLPTASTLRRLLAKIAPIALYIDPKEGQKVGETKQLPISFKLGYKSLAAMKQMRTELAVELENGESLLASNAAVAYSKLLQIEGGFAYNEGGDVVKFGAEKLEALKAVVEGLGGENVLVVIRYRQELEDIRGEFGADAVLLKEPEDFEAWNNGEVKVGIVHTKSVRFGVSLQHGGRAVVFYSLDADLESYLQVRERLGARRQALSGYNRTVLEYFLFAEGGLGPRLLAELERKRQQQQGLMSGLVESGNVKGGE